MSRLITVGCRVRNTLRPNPKAEDPFEGVVERTDLRPRELRDCVLVKWPGLSEGMCHPRKFLEVES